MAGRDKGRWWQGGTGGGKPDSKEGRGKMAIRGSQWPTAHRKTRRKKRHPEGISMASSMQGGNPALGGNLDGRWHIGMGEAW